MGSEPPPPPPPPPPPEGGGLSEQRQRGRLSRESRDSESGPDGVLSEQKQRGRLSRESRDSESGQAAERQARERQAGGERQTVERQARPQTGRRPQLPPSGRPSGGLSPPRGGGKSIGRQSATALVLNRVGIATASSRSLDDTGADAAQLIVTSFVDGLERLARAEHPERAMVFDVGALPPLICLMQSCDDPRVMASATSCLRHLATHPPHKHALIECGAVKELIGILEVRRWQDGHCEGCQQGQREIGREIGREGWREGRWR